MIIHYLITYWIQIVLILFSEYWRLIVHVDRGRIASWHLLISTVSWSCINCFKFVRAFYNNFILTHIWSALILKDTHHTVSGLVFVPRIWGEVSCRSSISFFLIIPKNDILNGRTWESSCDFAFIRFECSIWSLLFLELIESLHWHFALV